MKRFKVLATLMCFVNIVMIIASTSFVVGCAINSEEEPWLPVPPLPIEIPGVTLEWDPNALTDYVTHYRVYYGFESRNYHVHEEVSSLQTTHTFYFLVPNITYYFAVTAFNTYGESDYSNEVMWRIE